MLCLQYRVDELPDQTVWWQLSTHRSPLVSLKTENVAVRDYNSSTLSTRQQWPRLGCGPGAQLHHRRD